METSRRPTCSSITFKVQGDLCHSKLVYFGYFGNTTLDLPYTQNVNAAFPGSGPFAAGGALGLPYLSFGRNSPLRSSAATVTRVTTTRFSST